MSFGLCSTNCLRMWIYNPAFHRATYALVFFFFNYHVLLPGTACVCHISLKQTLCQGWSIYNIIWTLLSDSMLPRRAISGKTNNFSLCLSFWTDSRDCWARNPYLTNKTNLTWTWLDGSRRRCSQASFANKLQLQQQQITAGRGWLYADEISSSKTLTCLPKTLI